MVLTLDAAKPDQFAQISPVECKKLNSIAIYCMVLFALSLFSNALLLFILIKYKEFRNTTSIFMMSLTIFNLAGSILEFPFVIFSNYYCRWIFDKRGCIFSGFIMYFVGCTSIYLLVALSFERYCVIKNHTGRRYLSFKLTLFITALCILVSLFWSVMPFLGWSYYSLESSLTTCCVEWRDKSFNVVSYNINIFIFIYFVPLICIVLFNVKSIFMMKELNKFVKNLNQKSLIEKRIKFERNLVMRNVLIIGFYFISWTPYAFVSMYTAFFDPAKINPLASLIPSMFAKSTLFWTSLTHMIFDSRIRKKIKYLFCIKKQTHRKIKLHLGVHVDAIKN